MSIYPEIPIIMVIWEWILRIVGGGFLLFQVGIVIAVVVSGAVLVVWGIWKLFIFLANKEDW
ncbi:MAG: hypothetical protein H8E13_00850 [Actinobacteria bacterium]|nr:hypothetical protein [Actinomycetota bacterium]